ncbi:hypothetical protein GCU56_17850 [Geodermatophilus sabuli]|uniref:Uncharacterized protein n=1 Tax=Geodermatophilus sabuli TaxID=1564158 RepID=A0A7K3W4A7_9ACTN|nr:hypothetical protein [Geodermatophilus sabuli]NEK59725.1 hypothetical protein [Geodermatophilus sabuli]
MEISVEARAILEAVRAEAQPASMFALIQRLNPAVSEMGSALETWRQRQIHLLGSFSELHEAGYLESLPRDADQHSETFMLSVRGRGLLDELPAAPPIHRASALETRAAGRLRVRLLRRAAATVRSR